MAKVGIWRLSWNRTINETQPHSNLLHSESYWAAFLAGFSSCWHFSMLHLDKVVSQKSLRLELCGKKRPLKYVALLFVCRGWNLAQISGRKIVSAKQNAGLALHSSCRIYRWFYESPQGIFLRTKWPSIGNPISKAKKEKLKKPVYLVFLFSEWVGWPYSARLLQSQRRPAYGVWYRYLTLCALRNPFERLALCLSAERVIEVTFIN